MTIAIPAWLLSIFGGIAVIALLFFAFIGVMLLWTFRDGVFWK
jgi:hypothetical protein